MDTVSKCCGEPEYFKLEYCPPEQSIYGWIVCGHCGKKYRPAHKGHSGGGAPDNCFICLDMLKRAIND